MNNNRLLYLFWGAVCLFTATGRAQNLPNIQKNSLHLPEIFKVDGKNTEWAKGFQAYNKTIDAYYTMANNDTCVYFLLQAADPVIIKKIVLYGLQFTINQPGSKQEGKAFMLTFPVYDKQNPPFYILLNKQAGATKDSMAKALNQQLTSKLKTISIKGASILQDSLLSIYNESGIKTAARLNDELYYTYELAIPLKYLNSQINSKGQFRYNIKLNAPGNGDIRVVGSSQGDRLSYTGSDGINYSLGLATPQNMTLAYPLDFWADYTLTKQH